MSTVSYCRILNRSNHSMSKTIKSAGIIVVWYLVLATTVTRGQVHEQYIGCFVDNINDQQWEPVLKNQSDLTIEICIHKCHNATNRIQSETTFAALANGQECVCRNNSGQELRDRNCNVKCSGDQMQNCGGNTKSRFYSLYSVCRIGYFGPKCDKLCHCKRHLPCDRKTGICPDGCKEQWTGATCNISNIHKQYIGCYGDGNGKTEAVVMDVKNPGGKTGYNRPTTNSIEFCIQICSTSAYTYAGMQYGYDCFCGEKYAMYGNKTNDTNKEAICNFSCPANSNQICGGDYANSVYYVCPVGFYGRNCVNRCLCNGSPCRFSGSCLCKPGWMGSACNIRECRINNGDCESDEICESVDLGFSNSSMCRCKDGSFRTNNTCRLTHLRYIGCYEGNTTQYTSVELPANDTLTIEFCIWNCKQLNKKYSIIQGGTACLCGDDYGQISPDDECQVPCVGNKLQYCGGNNTVDGTSIYVVYTVNYRSYRCLIDKDCEQHETCNVINLNYMNVSRCRCQQGFHRMSRPTWGNCTDVDECKSRTSCSTISENCVNYAGSYKCECKNGFANVSGNCEDVDECRNDPSVCDEATELCTNTNGSYLCQCKHGYENTTFDNCTDVNECISGVSTCNATSEICVNNIGSYVCECKDGFVNTSGECEDIDECINDTVVCDAETELCKNTIGSYKCDCKPGYENMTNGNCTQCTDVDECKSNTSSCNLTSENCFNNIGSYRCECEDGFRNESGQCEDVDECNSSDTKCYLKIENCVNTLGSFTCRCKDGFIANNSKYCEDIDECQKNNKCNQASEYCINIIGSYICTSKKGFVDISGQSEEPYNTPAPCNCIIVWSLLAISVLINALFAVSKIKCLKSRHPGPGKEMAQSDSQPNYVNVVAQCEMNYNATPVPVDQNNIYEQMVPANRRIKQIPNSEYAELKLDDYADIESSL